MGMFLIGMVAGGILGFLVAATLSMSSRADEFMHGFLIGWDYRDEHGKAKPGEVLEFERRNYG